MLGYGLLFFGILIFVLNLYFFFISCGFRKNQCKKCKGFLRNTIQHENIYVGMKGGRFYKHFLDYLYVYRVNGKEYSISGGVPGTKRNIRPAVEIIYQKKNPKYAYVRGLTFPIQPVIAFLLCPLWILLVICGVFLI